MKVKNSAILIIAGLLLAACASGAPAAEATAPAVVEETTVVEDAAAVEEAATVDVSAETVSFSQDVWPILEKYALAAHGGKGGVYLESYEDITKYVTPGDPENSMLYKALIGDGLKRMPPDAPLPDALIQTIYDWIKQGALNN